MKIPPRVRQLDAWLAVLAFFLLPLLAVLISAGFETRIDRYRPAGILVRLLHYMLFVGGAYLLARAAGYPVRTRLAAALVLGILYCVGLVTPPLTLS